MRKAIVSLLVLLAAFWGATNQSKLQSWWLGVERQFLVFFGRGTTEGVPDDTLPESAPAPAPAVVAVPATAPAPSTPSGLPPLEDGVFYTRERITQVTDAGVSVIQARVKVRKVGEENGQFLVDDGRQRVLTTQARLTNDPTEVATLLQQDIPAPTTASKDAGKTSATSASRAAAQAERAANLTKARQLQAQINEIGRRISSLTDQVNILRSEARAAQARGRPSTYNDRTIATLISQISELEAQRARLNYEMAGIPR